MEERNRKARTDTTIKKGNLIRLTCAHSPKSCLDGSEERTLGTHTLAIHRWSARNARRRWSRRRRTVVTGLEGV